MKAKGIICLFVLLGLVNNQNLSCPELLKESSGQNISDLNRKFIINQELDCKWSPSDSEVQILEQELVQIQSVKHKVVAFQILVSQPNKVYKTFSTQMSSHCSQLLLLVDSTGAIYDNQEVSKTEKSSFKETGNVLNNLFSCWKVLGISQQLDTWQRLFKAIVINSEEVEEYSWGFFETRDNLMQLLSMVTAMESVQVLVKSTDYQQNSYKYFNYLYELAKYDQELSNMSTFKKLDKMIKQVFLKDNIVRVEKKDQRLFVEMVRLGGEKVNSNNITNVVGKWNVEGREVEVVLKQAGDKYVGRLNGWAAGVYQGQVTIDKLHIQKMTIVVVQTMSIKSVQYSIYNNGETGRQNKLQPVNQQQIYQADQNSRIQLKVELEEDGLSDLQLVAARMTMSNQQNVSTLVQMRKDKAQRATYNVIVDLGEPEQMAGISGQYELEVIVGDVRLNKSIRVSVMTVQVIYRREGQVVDELVYSTLPLLQHTFQPPPKHINPRLTICSTTAILLFSLIFLFRMVITSNSLNMANMGYIRQLSFVFILLSWAALLLVFWLYINLMQFVYYAFALALVTIVVGDQALIKLNQ